MGEKTNFFKERRGGWRSTLFLSLLEQSSVILVLFDILGLHFLHPTGCEVFCKIV